MSLSTVHQESISRVQYQTFEHGGCEWWWRIPTDNLFHNITHSVDGRFGCQYSNPYPVMQFYLNTVQHIFVKSTSLPRSQQHQPWPFTLYNMITHILKYPHTYIRSSSDDWEIFKYVICSIIHAHIRLWGWALLQIGRCPRAEQSDDRWWILDNIHYWIHRLVDLWNGIEKGEWTDFLLGASYCSAVLLKKERKKERKIGIVVMWYPSPPQSCL